MDSSHAALSVGTERKRDSETERQRDRESDRDRVTERQSDREKEAKRESNSAEFFNLKVFIKE